MDDNRLYRSLDAILAHKEHIEEHLARRGRDLYGRQYMALLYDLTSMYFEGSAEGIEKAKRRIEWRIKPEYGSQVRENEGVYVPRTNLPEASPEDLWKGHMTLTRWSIEHTYRSHGGTLTGRGVLDVLSGIQLATITLRAVGRWARKKLTRIRDEFLRSVARNLLFVKRDSSLCSERQCAQDSRSP